MLSARRIGLIGVVCFMATLAAVAIQRVAACPFCSAVSLTFTEEIGQADAAVIAKLTQLPPKEAQGQNTLDAGKAKFEIVEVLKGEKALGDTRKFEAIYFGDNPVGTMFLVMGIEPPQINWSTPIAVNDRARAYLLQALKQPKEGADRLAFFQDYLEEPDEMLARDAYDEFAKAPYATVRELKDRMKHARLIEWIKNPQVPASRRRLYLTMLGVCGTAQDSAVMEDMMQSKDRQLKAGLDALIAAYLTLKGPDGMPLVEDLFLKNKDAEYTDTYAAVMALRFHGQEEKAIPRERLLGGFHHMLNRPQLADLVIPDLARWEDWSMMDRLVELFKNADDESSWVRVPVVNYLRACPLPKAKTYLDELAKIDPETVKRANSFFPFGAAAAPAATAAKKDDKADTKAAAAGNDRAPKPDASTAKKKTKSSKTPPVKSGAKADEREGQGRASIAAAAKRGVASARASQEAGAAVSTSRIFGGLFAAAVALVLVFLAILRGGQHAAA